jgi:hypothetical protein
MLGFRTGGSRRHSSLRIPLVSATAAMGRLALAQSGTLWHAKVASDNDAMEALQWGFA